METIRNNRIRNNDLAVAGKNGSKTSKQLCRPFPDRQADDDARRAPRGHQSSVALGGLGLGILAGDGPTVAEVRVLPWFTGDRAVTTAGAIGFTRPCALRREGKPERYLRTGGRPCRVRRSPRKPGGGRQARSSSLKAGTREVARRPTPTRLLLRCRIWAWSGVRQSAAPSRDTPGPLPRLGRSGGVRRPGPGERG